MKKITIMLAVFSLAFAELKAQSIVDPGVSIHNYKHPNKAAKARALAGEAGTVKVPSYNTVNRFSKARNSGDLITPKYAPRPAALVIVRERPVEKMQLDPLSSPANYKTPFSKRVKQPEAIADQSSETYPTVD
ncbi:hypothetical protein [Dyadobacter sandarakinus]|uniref:Uncharacterized protein n=1 Tax=Dyadobacter sandarakinus TaxID=2747268 RepID=A0ABX7I3I1_9BACT|nr:hypothetical protein [Dyadobacter sandarakinus]QRR00355.1 hypothetical protein HWI92_05255 [Dyadobacter sandarakinus]